METHSLHRKRSHHLGRLVGLTGVVAALSSLAIAVGASPALAAHDTSQGVAMIPGPQPENNVGPDGIMPETSVVTGRTSESFSSYSFASLSRAQVSSSALSGYDTVVLNQVYTDRLSAAAKSAIQQFVANGGKLLIFDSDETSNNDYSWLLGTPTGTTAVGNGCDSTCGSQSGTASILANSPIISANANDPSYVDLGQLDQFTDQGDANLLTSTDQRWTALVSATNARSESGAVVAYATVGNGLIVYNGFDTDFIKPNAQSPFRCDTPNTNYQCTGPVQPTTDWLAQMWYSELHLGWGATSGAAGGVPGGGSSLPTSTPVVSIGTKVSGGAAGLPAQGKACVARKSLFLRLKRFGHMRGRKIVQVDVYINRRHILRERGRFSNRTLRRLQHKGYYTVTVIATTKRRYHLIAKHRYHAC